MPRWGVRRSFEGGEEPEQRAVSEFEAACADTELKATALVKATRHAERVATKLQRAAQLGDHAAIGAATDELRDALVAVQVCAQAAQRAWPFDDDQLATYLDSRYQAELVRAAKSAGMAINPLDDRLAAFPVVIQIQPAQRSIKLDSTRTTALRPSTVVTRIEAQRKKAGAKPHQFIEVLYEAYARARTTSSSGATLADLYRILTLHPDARRIYSRAEFARDVFLLDSSNVRRTKGGAVVTFPAATGTKGGRDAILVVTDDGMPKHYYGILFQEADS
jgi:hypothetical protein